MLEFSKKSNTLMRLVAAKSVCYVPSTLFAGPCPSKMDGD